MQAGWLRSIRTRCCAPKPAFMKVCLMTTSSSSGSVSESSLGYAGMRANTAQCSTPEFVKSVDNAWA
eukprot:4602987-Lingulodinium_polyedra.AAC.1